MEIPKIYAIFAIAVPCKQQTNKQTNDLYPMTYIFHKVQSFSLTSKSFYQKLSCGCNFRFPVKHFPKYVPLLDNHEHLLSKPLEIEAASVVGPRYQDECSNPIHVGVFSFAFFTPPQLRSSFALFSLRTYTKFDCKQQHLPLSRKIALSKILFCSAVLYTDTQMELINLQNVN